jgi:hypothetical protein
MGCGRSPHPRYTPVLLLLAAFFSGLMSFRPMIFQSRIYIILFSYRSGSNGMLH